jgi:hypothetical protein
VAHGAARGEEEAVIVSRISPVVAVVFMLSVGCESKPTEPTGSSTASARTTAGQSDSKLADVAPAGSHLGSDYTDEQVPVPGDFEAAAAKAVTKDNYKAKLAELDGQIAGGPSPSASASASAAPKEAAPKEAAPKEAAPKAAPSAAPKIAPATP